MSGGWEQMWAANGGLRRGAAFDVGGASPALTAWAARQQGAPPGAKAVIPGAGRSYDVLAKLGYQTSTWDIAPSAVNAAKSMLVEDEIPKEITERISIEERNFFDAGSDAGFDLAWDCTFLCAIQLEQREAWAARYAKLIKPGGMLVSLVFPVFPENHERRGVGPPFHLDTSIVKGLLEPHGFRVIEERSPLPEDEQHLKRGPFQTVSSSLLVFQKEGSPEIKE